ncbi:hypothetical protein IIB34_03720 [PVC group bacterium]|nr:hypothetical protein [PVC group bacterium]
MKQLLKLLAPYFAVGLFWCIFKNAWLAILAYHVQILFWSRKSIFDVRMPDNKSIMLLATSMIMAGPILYYLLPYMTRIELSSWLEDYHLSRLSFMIMIPYFGLIHPFLEQLHWTGLRDRTPLAHPVFAGYHMLVLYSLLTIPWLIMLFVILTAASLIWQQMGKKSNSLLPATMSHILADLGVVVVAWVKT